MKPIVKLLAAFAAALTVTACTAPTSPQGRMPDYAYVPTGGPATVIIEPGIDAF